MKKRRISVLMAAVLIVSTMVSGCGGASSATTAAASKAAAAATTKAATAAAGAATTKAAAAASTAKAAAAKTNVAAPKGPGKVTLKRLGYNVAFDPNKDIMAGVIKEKTGYDVQYFTLPAQNADEKLAMEVAGGGDYDVVQCSVNQFQTLKSQGALMPLNDLLDAYGKDVKSGVSEDSWRACSDENGTIYGIPYKYPHPQEVAAFMVCRLDLMKAAGITKVPTTIDEFYNDLVALKKFYGDKYIILSGPFRAASEGNENWVFPKTIASAFGIYNDWMVDKDGKVYYMTESPNFQKMIDFLSKCSKEGLLDPDWAVNTTDTVNEKFSGGKSIIACSNRAGVSSTTPAIIKNLGIGYDDLGYIAALSGSDGTCTYMRTEAINQVTVILKSCKNASDAINWINLKQQNQLFINIGVEGTHFTYDKDHKISPINPIFAQERGNSYWYIDSTNEKEYAEEWPSRVRKSDAQWAAFQVTTLDVNKNTPKIFVNNDFAFKPSSENYSTYNTSLFKSLNDYILQVLAGTKTINDLDAFKKEWANAGGEKVRTELQTWYTSFYKNKK